MSHAFSKAEFFGTPFFTGDTPEEKADVAEVLDRIRGSQAFKEQLDDGDGSNEAITAEPEEISCIMAEDTARLKAHKSDHVTNEKLNEAMMEMFGPADVITGTDMDYFMPRDGRRTLSRALRGHESVEAAQNDLVRLLCYLRMAPFGCDSDVLPNPLHTRKLSLGRPTKWQNIFRHEVAKADAMEKLPGQRKSRQSAWVEITEKARHKAAPSLPTNLAISSGDLVAVHHQGDWKVAAVLTLWRFFKKGNGAQQVTQEIPRGSLHSARVVIMDLDPENKEVYSCNSTSTFVVVPCDNIGLRLDTAEMKKKVNIQGLKILLPEELCLVCGAFSGVWSGIIQAQIGHENNYFVCFLIIHENIFYFF